MAMVGVAEEVTSGSPTDDEYVRGLARFGLEPIRCSDGSGRAGSLRTDEIQTLRGEDR